MGGVRAVSDAHLTLPTERVGYGSVVAVVVKCEFVGAVEELLW